MAIKKVGKGETLQAPKKQTNMKQIYLDLFDIIPTEGKWVEPNDNPVDPDEKGHNHYTDWLEPIRKEGVLFALLVHPDGHIADGNFRYWCLRHLWMETGDWKWRRVPVNPWFYTGMCFGIMNEKGERYLSLREDIITEVPISFHLKIPVKKNWPFLRNYNDDELGHGSHPYAIIKKVRGFPFIGSIVSEAEVIPIEKLKKEVVKKDGKTLKN